MSGDVGLTRWQEIRHRRVVIPAHVASRSLAEETVLLNLKTGKYHGLNEVGARFVGTIYAARHLADASEALAAHYGQPLERVQEDLAAFIDGLSSHGLIELQEPD